MIALFKKKKNIILILVMCICILSLTSCNKDEIQKLQIELSDKEESLLIIENELSKLQDDFIVLIDEHSFKDEEVSKLKKEISALKNELKELDNFLDTKINDNEKLSNTINELNQVIDNKQNEITSLYENISKLQNVMMNINNPQKFSNIFDFNEIKELDHVGNMIVIEKTGTLQFKGATTLTGTFRHNSSESFVGSAIGFIVDESSLENIPKEINDNRMVWFLLDGYNETKKYFGEPGDEGIATIIIDDYFIHLGSGDVYNSATLVYVINMEVTGQ